ncbi:MAG: hypothetical protein GEU94_13270 [Micromonosporaceae bacterium]|nr:hypothetical protein [Micromonosporaceae bacterium]
MPTAIYTHDNPPPAQPPPWVADQRRWALAAQVWCDHLRHLTEPHLCPTCAGIPGPCPPFRLADHVIITEWEASGEALRLWRPDLWGARRNG